MFYCFHAKFQSSTASLAHLARLNVEKDVNLLRY